MRCLCSNWWSCNKWSDGHVLLQKRHVKRFNAKKLKKTASDFFGLIIKAISAYYGTDAFSAHIRAIFPADFYAETRTAFRGYPNIFRRYSRRRYPRIFNEPPTATRGYSGLMLAVVYFIRRISLFYAPRGLEKYRKNTAFYGFLKSRARFSKAFFKALSRSLR